ncbi:hypothetical protein APY04_0340 [Hyphomicrobium sulfonivorans]|uniref:Uncharacterized protein n=1 Tax=Hyphomicrobium sulfonivorans TaxID=121290 RepID=A0A120CY72_HYPSL|nr:hypothetical protein APY04_0340 [Hyphomicrobium sulfonivorans]
MLAAILGREARVVAPRRCCCVGDAREVGGRGFYCDYFQQRL